MSESLTYAKVLDLISESSRKFNENLEKSRIEFEEKLEKGFEKSRKEFDKKIGKISNTLGSFVEGLVEPELLELFQNRGILVTETYHNVEIHGKGFGGAEIDLLLANSRYSVAVEVKATLTVEDVKEHLSRLVKLQKNPIRIVRNTTLFGAVAGMRIVQNADKFASRQGLFVLKQKGEIVEIANHDKFQPKEWKIE